MAAAQGWCSYHHCHAYVRCPAALQSSAPLRYLNRNLTTPCNTMSAATSPADARAGNEARAVFRYALPVQKGVAVASTKDWDDFGLWTRVFAARGWHETKQRNTVEYGLEFRAQLAPASQGPEINISPTNSERVLLRWDEPSRSRLHNKRQLFKHLTAAQPPLLHIPRTVFTAAACLETMAMHPSPAVWFYKRSKASRGQGVFPFTQQQLQALIQTKQGQAQQQEQKDLSHELGQEQQRHTADQQPDSVSANTAPCSILSGSGTGAVPTADSGMGQARPGAVASSLQAICTVDTHDSALPSEVMDEEPDGVFQQQVPNMALWANRSSDATGAGTPAASVNAIVPSDLADAGSDMSPGSKFDLRVLVVMGPGPSVLVGRTLFVRTTGVSFSTQALSRSVQCTNISQGGQVYAWGPKAASCAPAGDGSATPAVGSSRSGGSGDRIIIYGGSSSDSGNNCKASTSVIPPLPVIAACASVPVTQPQGSDSMHHHKRPASQETSSQPPAGVAYEPVFTHVCEAVADVAVQYRSLMRDNSVHYFGFDYMLDSAGCPWLLEVNSTPRLVNCDSAPPLQVCRQPGTHQHAASCNTDSAVAQGAGIGPATAAAAAAAAAGGGQGVSAAPRQGGHSEVPAPARQPLGAVGCMLEELLAVIIEPALRDAQPLASHGPGHQLEAAPAHVGAPRRLKHWHAVHLGLGQG